MIYQHHLVIPAKAGTQGGELLSTRHPWAPACAGATALGNSDDRSDPLFLDGAEVEAAPGETIWQVADRQGIEIPHLCWLPKPGYRADGNCRACMVEIEGERVLAASCVRQPAPGMKVQTASERARFSRKMVFELLVGDQPDARRRARPEFAAVAMGRQAGGQRQPLPAARARRRPTAAIRRWRCSSTPASSAISACAPAARSRSTT